MVKKSRTNTILKVLKAIHMTKHFIAVCFYKSHSKLVEEDPPVFKDKWLWVPIQKLGTGTGTNQTGS